MAKPTPVMVELLQLMADAGGSHCPGEEAINRISREGKKLLRWPVYHGYLTEEATDDGPRYTLTASGWDEVRHG